MYKYIPFLFILVVFSGCHKMGENLNPTKSIDSPTNGGYNVKYSIEDQAVLTSVKEDTLFLNYTEKVSLLLNPEDYQNSSAVHFKEDFSKSQLANYTFRMLNDKNQYVYSADDNLNNVKIKSASTITLNDVKYTKLVLERLFTFYKAYKQQSLAIEQQNNIMLVTNDQITFSAYYYYNGKNSATTTAISKVTYKK